MKIRVDTPFGSVELHSRRLPDGNIRWINRPDFSKRVLSEQQTRHHTRFQEAAQYARQTARTVPLYAELAAKDPLRNAYNIAMSDWFHPPEILEIDLSQWRSEIGQQISIQTQDDVQVTQVTVMITDEQDTLLEQGQAVKKDDLLWRYTTQTVCRGKGQVLVTAQDLPGHSTSLSAFKE